MAERECRGRILWFLMWDNVSSGLPASLFSSCLVHFLLGYALATFQEEHSMITMSRLERPPCCLWDWRQKQPFSTTHLCYEHCFIYWNIELKHVGIRNQMLPCERKTIPLNGFSLGVAHFHTVVFLLRKGLAVWWCRAECPHNNLIPQRDERYEWMNERYEYNGWSEINEKEGGQSAP